MIKALDINGRPFVKEAKDGELLARAIQHEFDHLDGKLFIDHCRNIFDTTNVLQKYNLPPLEQDWLIEEDELEKEIEEFEKNNPQVVEERQKEIEELEKQNEQQN